MMTAQNKQLSKQVKNLQSDVLALQQQIAEANAIPIMVTLFSGQFVLTDYDAFLYQRIAWYH
jgi:hypothetical protein